MKKVKIHTILSNHENETTNLEIEADYNEKENTLTYKEADLTTTIEILDNMVRIIRKNDDYDLTLEFKENVIEKSKYIVKSIGLDLDIEVETTLLEIDDNRIYINYELFNENKSIGKFEYKIFKEW